MIVFVVVCLCDCVFVVTSVICEFVIACLWLRACGCVFVVVYAWFCNCGCVCVCVFAVLFVIVCVFAVVFVIVCLCLRL